MAGLGSVPKLHFALTLVTILAELVDSDPKEREILDKARESAKSTDEDNTE